MRKKGFQRIESPEKMPAVTSGIQMSRSDPQVRGGEAHRGGNSAADESMAAKLVADFIASSR